MVFGLIVLVSVLVVGVALSWLYAPSLPTSPTSEERDDGVRRFHGVHVDAAFGGAWVEPGAVDGFPDEEYDQFCVGSQDSAGDESGAGGVVEAVTWTVNTVEVDTHTPDDEEAAGHEAQSAECALECA